MDGQKERLSSEMKNGENVYDLQEGRYVFIGDVEQGRT